MIRFIYGKDEEIAAFVAQRTGLRRGIGDACKAIGVMDGLTFLGGVVYHHWSPEAGTIVMSGAAVTPRWLTRAVLQRIFDYPFVECECQMLIMQPKASDFRLQRQLAEIGFAFDKVRRLYGRNEDGIIATLTDGDWAASRFNRGAAKLEEAA